jgi:hypothetical protein
MLLSFFKKKGEKKGGDEKQNGTGVGEMRTSRNFEGWRPLRTQLHIIYIGIYRQRSDSD